MIKVIREIRLKCDGDTVLQGHIDKLSNIKCGQIRSWSFPCHHSVQLEVAIYQIVVRERGKKHYGGFVTER